MTLNRTENSTQNGAQNLPSVGGFQSGFYAVYTEREKCKYPQYLICAHGCKTIIQLVSKISGEVEFELCEIEAEKMANVLLDAVTKGRARNG